jgi:hypothetical protein
LVLISYYVDEEPEWRTFGIEDNINEYDPNHLGSLSDPLLTQANLATTISKPAKGGTTTVAISKNWLINRQSNPDGDLIQGFEIIETMARRLCLALEGTGKQCQRLVYSSLVRRISCQEH